jgi:hypothetical protein
MLPLKYKTMEELVANHIGKVFCVDHNNVQAWDLGFCVALELGKGWEVDKLLISRLNGADGDQLRFLDGAMSILYVFGTQG